MKKKLASQIVIISVENEKLNNNLFFLNAQKNCSEPVRNSVGFKLSQRKRKNFLSRSSLLITILEIEILMINSFFFSIRFELFLFILLSIGPSYVLNTCIERDLRG